MRSSGASDEDVAALVPFLAALKESSDGVKTEELEHLAIEHGVHPELLNRALHLFSRRAGRYWLTGRGSNFLTAAANRTSVSVQVLPHALDRAVQRRLISGESPQDRQTAIEQDVRDAFAAGRYSRDKPRWTRITGRGSSRNSEVPLGLLWSEHQFYVWNEAKSRVWAVRKGTHEWVVTTGFRRVHAHV